MGLLTALIYWVIVAIWLAVLGTVTVFYFRNQRAFGTTRLLLAVLGLDTLRNIIENSYFGAYFGGQFGLLPASLVGALGHPLLLILPKLLNVIAGCVVLSILLLRWLPQAVCERQTAMRAADVLREQATHDGLTGLFNRSHFLVLAESEWERAQRYARPLSMLILDLDFFKSINDGYGHDTGDRMLMQVAQACRDCTRGADIVGRLGGEEFAVLLPETRVEDAFILAERLRRAVAELRIAHQEGEVTVTVSIGVAEAGWDTGIPSLIKQADLALYASKHAGRNRVSVYDPSDAHVEATA
jgi:diguanylate cyclase (GGDEF)-like protein